ncbi:PstS family phosphate ABC transporter substrate-binding protein [Flavobacterium sp. GT3R68]|uniref:PstS family phosphate ABC transporter substrate-binding protein n=1 Tax=Flavobacterium sp. GT3R68 TaxID=2594437 RepID=UPI000F872DC4|nr:substrate-binding domain-containing protein [Flavobacterium sp. GT3R68]RTY92517.1 phosphate ABC transporter substrate-binding protein [Flavobacterium sp. GSN2]TRW94143.1 phosphate ABC transporter substrate-binding protein [Flavobacterium sp. GT3R68]
MKKVSKLYYVIILFVVAIIFACNQSSDSKNNEETIITGSTSILVDETLKPIVEDQIAVFESKYAAKIKMIAQSEAEVIDLLVKDSSGIAVLSRTLTSKEAELFEKRKITPKVTKFAIDAIAFISNKSNKDTLIALQDVIDFMKGKPRSTIKGLVFDNPNSSTVRYMNGLAGLEITPEKGIFSFKTNEEVIKFVSENEGMIGVVGVNWLSQPSPAMTSYVEKVNMLSVKSITGTGFFEPTQNNIAEGTYPLARDLYIINCQGFSGLGMGFSSFVAGDIGQRIILKSGLLPVRIPGRNIRIRKEIENKKK